jgi:hypothetical protein
MSPAANGLPCAFCLAICGAPVTVLPTDDAAELTASPADDALSPIVDVAELVPPTTVDRGCPRRP